MKNLHSYRLPRLKEDNQQHQPHINLAIVDFRSQHCHPDLFLSSRSFPFCHNRLASCLFFLSLSLLILQSATFVECQTLRQANPYEHVDQLEPNADAPSTTLSTLLSATPCKGEWKYPAGCNKNRCDYRASWEFLDEEDEIVFTIATKNRNKWTGIGFSENQAMPETDAILGLVEER